MASSQDTEITLGTGKLLFLFFGLVAICALFFALGYSLGKKSEPTMAAASPTVPQTTSGSQKASGGSTAPPMTFYKAVEQKDANPELTPPAETTKAGSTPTNTTSAQSSNASTPDSNATLPSAAGYFVQVAAVSKQEDADALVEALKKKEYPAFVAAPTPDKLFRVQVGPFSDIKEAESMRTRLTGDGYSPILKK